MDLPQPLRSRLRLQRAALGYTILRKFRGAQPDTPLIIRNGNLYGAAATPNGGAVFELQPPSIPGGDWTTTYLHDIQNRAEIAGPLTGEDPLRLRVRRCNNRGRSLR